MFPSAEIPGHYLSDILLTHVIKELCVHDMLSSQSFFSFWDDLGDIFYPHLVQTLTFKAGLEGGFIVHSAIDSTKFFLCPILSVAAAEHKLIWKHRSILYQHNQYGFPMKNPGIDSWGGC